MDFDILKSTIKEYATIAVNFLLNKEVRRKFFFCTIIIILIIASTYKTLLDLLKSTPIPEVLNPYIIIVFCVAIGALISDIVITFFMFCFNRLFVWGNLSKEELEYIKYYISNNTHTRYVRCLNGTYADSGTLELLVRKRIIYLASTMSEFRDDEILGKSQQFPFNIHNNAYKFFAKRLRNKKSISNQ